MRIVNSVEEKKHWTDNEMVLPGVGSNSKDKITQNLQDQSVQRTRDDLMQCVPECIKAKIRGG